MLYNQELYCDLMGYLGIEPGNGLPDTDNKVLQAINRGLQKCYTMGPFFMKRSPGACVFPGPVGITLNVTQGSTVVSGINGWLPSMLGCTVRIAGEPGDNEFVSSTGLVVPISQSSSNTVAATVYFNCFNLPPGVISVAGDVYLDGWRQLDPLFYEEHQPFAKTYSHNFFDYSGAYILQNSGYLRLEVGVPVGYYVRPASVQTGPYYLQQLRVWPLPGNAHTVTWINENSAPRLTLPSLEINPDPNNPGSLLAPTLITPLPGDSHESTWLPLARMALSSYPYFLEAKRAFVQADAAEAIAYLKLLEPQRQSGAMIRPRVRLPH